MKIDFQKILDLSSDGISIYAPDGLMLYANKSMLDLLENNLVIGRNTIHDLEKRKDFSDLPALTALREKKSVSRQITWNNRKIFQATAVPVLNDANELLYVISYVHDITEVSRLNSSMEKLASDMGHYKAEAGLLRSFFNKTGANEFIAESQSSRKLFLQALKVASAPVSVMLLGESGTGKSFLAKLIHQASGRKEGPFVVVNCGAIPENLLESELFGYEKGSFTGADSRKQGLLECANGGTIFLDEVADLPLAMQVKLLSVLHDRKIRRVGGVKDIPIDVRIVSATNQDIKKYIEAGMFRSDLLFRLNTVVLEIPPLRERKEDLARMIITLLDQFNKKYNVHKALSSSAFVALAAWSWPGNVRELSNTIESMVVMSTEQTIDIDLLPRDIREILPVLDITESDTLQSVVERAEKNLLIKTLRTHRTTRAIARHLHSSCATICRKLKKYGLSGELEEQF